MPKSNPAIPLDGYAPVADRITLFYERYPDGRIITDLVSNGAREVVFKARVYRTVNEPRPAATGWASEREGDGDVNAVACLENTETSAIGRALANLGFTASRRRPSYEEMQKVERARQRMAPARPTAPPSSSKPAQAAAVPMTRTRSTTAHAKRDLEDLITEAELAGFSTARGRAIRKGLGNPANAASIGRIEASIRAWLARHSM